MGRKDIEKYSTGYALLKYCAGFWHNNVFYRKVIVIGRDNINPDDHIIFAPNHQNALMDALAVLFTHKGQPVFLARADIFRRKAIAGILYFLKILPVYRIRDGFSNLKSNDEIFLKTLDILRNKNGLIILPEGDHSGFRRLRQLKKGICRIAFQSAEAEDFRLNIKIIPVGIEFSHYTRFRQVLTVVYGKPVEVSEYYESYRKFPEKALNELRERLSNDMKKIMVHIESVDDYNAIDELRTLVNGRYSDDVTLPKLFRDRILINKMNRLKNVDTDTYNKICALTLEIKNESKDLRLSYRILEKHNHPSWLLAIIAFAILVTFPLYLFGNIFNLTFLEIPAISIKRIRDEQFHSSVKYGLSLAMAFIFLPVYAILSFIFFSPWWFALLIFLSIPLSGMFAWLYSLLAGRLTGGIRIRKYISSGNERYLKLRKNYDKLLELISRI
jgi:1-acyl-sn-glycerol-3-phosphate acyltransferase